MGYLHIDNLYKAQDILLFKRCYALEKIHGTSAHIHWSGAALTFFSGGESHERFSKLFNADTLIAQFTERFGSTAGVTVYGEAYGGKCQGMSKTYGSDLKFIAFDVKVGDVWLAVRQAEDVVAHLGLDFVFCEEIPAELEAIDAARDKDSYQAIRNGMGEGKIREGVVLRPLVEVTMNNGSRIIAKHKRVEFGERATIPDVDPAKRQMMGDAQSIADEWVVPMRLVHVLDKLGGELTIQRTGEVINAMIEDVMREAYGEIVDSSHIRKAVGGKAARLYRQHLNDRLSDPIQMNEIGSPK